jgi:hypothetical protein
MARSSLPVAGPKQRGPAPIIPLAGALAAMPFAPISPGLAQPSPVLRQPLPPPPPMSPGLSNPRATVTPPALVVQGKGPLKVKPPRLKPLKPPGVRRGGLV